MSVRLIDRARRNLGREDGVVLVIFALTVVVLMVFVTFAVDMGAGLNERRQDVSAADSASLGAITQVGDAGKRTKAIELVNANLDEPIDPAAFNTCADDAGRLPVSVLGANDCVTFNATRTQLRVRVPYRSIAYFAPAAGLDGIEHSATATAEIRTEGFGEVLPFGLGVDGSGHQCMRNDSGNNTACSGSSSGNFGEADFSVFGVAACANTSNPYNDDDRLQFNAANGIDHEVTLRGADARRLDADVCNGGLAGAPNSVRKASGLTPQKFGDAVVFGFTLDGETFTGRLARSIDGWWGSNGSHRTSINGTEVDNVGLWEYIEDSSNSSQLIPQSCRKNQFEGPGSIQGSGSDIRTEVRNHVTATYPDAPNRMRVMLERCFAHYANGVWSGLIGDWDGDPATPPTGEPRIGCIDVASTSECTEALFTRHDGIDDLDHDAVIDMQLSPRFGYTPRLTGSGFSGNSPRDIVRFRAVYLYRLCGDKCTDPSANTYFHDPGFPVSGSPTANRVGDLTAFVFSDNMLPDGLAGADAPFDVGTNRFVWLIR